MEKKKVARAIRMGFEGAGRRRDRWLYGLAAFASVAIFALFWCTNVFWNAILSNLELQNGTSSFLLWQRPPVGLTFKVYVFNYTNLREFESGNATRLRVEEVGPYVYRESMSRVNVKMHENGTLTYQEQRSYQWISGESENDPVIVPNVLLMSAVALSRNYRYFWQILLTTVLPFFRAEPFHQLSVGEYLWDNQDRLYQMLKLGASLKQPLPSNYKFGILAFKEGVSPDRITMYTGAGGDLRKLGLIQSINGMEKNEIWGDERCNRVYGTDGSIFPPHWIENRNATLYVYMRDACRQLQLRYERRSFASGIPTLRYAVPNNFFTSIPNQDSCFCSKEASNDTTSGGCPPAGLFNISACKFGAPLLLSLPHFYLADETLLQRIDGLTPRPDDHKSYIDIHPRLGVAVDARSRFQLNLEVRKAVGVPFTGKLEDGLILPLIWIDAAIDELPESVQQVFYRSYYLMNAVEATFQWCSLIVAVLSIGAFVVTFTRTSKRETYSRSSDSSTAPIERNGQP